MSSSDLLRNSPTNYKTIADRPPRPERSSSPLTTSELARRIRAAITPPRSRRDKSIEFETRPRSATASPSLGLTTATELIGQMPERQKTASCGELGRLEQIFEPRLAPYTPPLRMRRGLDLEDRSPSLRGLSDEEIEKLETKLFEPRDAACTPPLRRKLFRKSASSDVSDGAAERGNRSMRKVDSARSVDSSSSEDSVNNEMVNDLQKMVFQMRDKARASSLAAVQQLAQLQNSTPNNSEEVTVRQLAQLQHKSDATRQPNVVSCC